MAISDVIRPETAHSINGVQGRLFALRVPPAPWAAGTFANQKWVSEARAIRGYGTGARLTVEIRFDDGCRNGHNTFTITSEVKRPGAHDIEAGGCLHDEIAKVFPGLAYLIKWHLVSTDGPMHYVANTLYHAQETTRNFDFARGTAVWPEATDEELCVPVDKLKVKLNARLPALLTAFRADIEAAGFMWECPQRAALSTR